jgi:hypothetical protein
MTRRCDVTRAAASHKHELVAEKCFDCRLASDKPIMQTLPHEVQEQPSAAPSGGWTVALICIGMAIIACCVLVPAADENRRIAYESLKLKADLEQIKKQIEVNDEFLHRVAEDPSLSERLAQRQMKMVREGTSVLTLRSQPLGREMSPFELVTVPPPPDLPPYQPVGGLLASMCRNPRAQLYSMGAAMLLIAAGLVLSYSRD